MPAVPGLEGEPNLLMASRSFDFFTSSILHCLSFNLPGDLTKLQSVQYGIAVDSCYSSYNHLIPTTTYCIVSSRYLEQRKTQGCQTYDSLGPLLPSEKYTLSWMAHQYNFSSNIELIKEGNLFFGYQSIID
jgi:hypothetical protein